MELHKLKVEKMLDAKKLVLSIIFFTTGICQSQNIIGKYQRTDPSNGVGIQYKFQENSDFEKIEFGHLESRTRSKGKYIINNDSLILNYEEVKTQNRELVKKKEIKPLGSEKVNSLYLEVKVHNILKEPLSGVNMALLNNKEEIIMGFTSDSKGDFPSLNLYNNYISSIHLSALGKEEVSINTDSLFGYRSEIHIYLNKTTNSVNSEVKTEKYLIENKTENNIQLISLPNRKRIYLKKIK